MVCTTVRVKTSCTLYYARGALTEADEKRLVTFEKKILRCMFGIKKDAENNEYERRTKENVRMT